MKYSDAFVGGQFKIVKSPGHYEFMCNGSYHTDLRLDDNLQCIEINHGSGKSGGNVSIFKKVNRDGTLGSSKYICNNHTSLKPNGKVNMKDAREQRKLAASRQVELLQGKIDKATEKLDGLKAELKEKQAELDNLNKYASDEEALAHTLSDIMQGDGTPEAILAALREHGKTLIL